MALASSSARTQENTEIKNSSLQRLLSSDTTLKDPHNDTIYLPGVQDRIFGEMTPEVVMQSQATTYIIHR